VSIDASTLKRHFAADAVLARRGFPIATQFTKKFDVERFGANRCAASGIRGKVQAEKLRKGITVFSLYSFFVPTVIDSNDALDMVYAL